MAEKALSREQKEKIEKQRQNALSIRMKKSATSKPAVLTVETLKKNVLSVDGVKYIDSQGGFLVKEKQREEPKTVIDGFDEEWNPEPIECKECTKDFLTSYLKTHFNYNVCDGCRDEKEKHSLITKTDAKSEYLLKDCDFDLREPPLKFVSKKNPHKTSYGEMKLYLLPQVEARAIEVHGSFEKIEQLHQERTERRQMAKNKKYTKDLKKLRMSVRSSLFNKTTGPEHQHDFSDEVYNEEDDVYSRTCKTCNFVDSYEKM